MCPPPPVTVAPTPPVVEQRGRLEPAAWTQLPDWGRETVRASLDAFTRSCAVLEREDAWKAVCAGAQTLAGASERELASFFELNFDPYRVVNDDGTDTGLVTGYYEPLLRGSRTRTARYRVPLYAVPADLLTIDLSPVYPDLKNRRLRGRLEGSRVVPYFSRGEIDRDDAPLGRALIDRGEITRERASMQGIKDWVRRNPVRAQEMLNTNPSYVFFRELPRDLPGPLGAQGVPLTPERSIAVDARVVPLGAPVYLATTWPNTADALNRLMIAQDTGGAIAGGVRADFFWGFGDEAGAFAGRMRQQGRMWVLWPKRTAPPAP